jgi:GT2 family glycosyltransferase
MEENNSKQNSQISSQSKSYVDIIVVNWNGLDHLEVCLTALVNQSYVNVNIFLVDNGSTDGSINFVQERFPTVITLTLEKNFGFCFANNFAISLSNSDFVALINNDTEADPNWISSAISTLMNKPNIGFIASRICLFDQRDIIDTCGDLYFTSGYPDKRGWLKHFSEEYNSQKLVFGACAGAAIYRRSMLDDIGLFDEEYFAFQEDVDLSFRAQLFGYQCLYEPNAIVYHKVGATAAKLNSARTFWSHRNHWYTLIKNLPCELFFKYSFSIFFAELVVFLSSINQKNFTGFVKARISVLRNIKRLLSLRKSIQQNRKSSTNYIDSIISRSWFSQRLNNKNFEKDSQI